jgi:trk/ktr system potassium uptake protein
VETQNIVIVGGGQVGQTLALRLSRDGHDISLVESDPAKVRALGDLIDAQIVEGNGATERVLRQAGIERASLMVASTNSDETNVLAGLLAAVRFAVPRVVVRLHDPDHQRSFEALFGADPAHHVCVNPDLAAVDRIAELLQVPGALDVVSFLGGELLVAGFPIRESSDFAGLRVSDMTLLFAGTPTLTVAIHRANEWLIPHGEETIHAGDLVYFAIERGRLEDVLSLVGVPADARRRIMVAGASTIGLALARRLETVDAQLVVIEPDADRARRASQELGHAMVVRGEITDPGLLEDEEIERVSTFVAVTDDHETNLVAGLLAKRLGAGRAFVLVDNPALVAMVGAIGIDAIISPRSLTIGLTLEHIRGASVRSGAALLEDEVEVMEAEVPKGCRLVSGSLSEIALPRGVLVAAIRHGEHLQVPSGTARIEPGDRVLLITTTALAPRVTEYLQAG